VLLLQGVSATVLNAHLGKEVGKSTDGCVGASDMNFKHNTAFQTFPLTNKEKEPR